MDCRCSQGCSQRRAGRTASVKGHVPQENRAVDCIFEDDAETPKAADVGCYPLDASVNSLQLHMTELCKRTLEPKCLLAW